uniref:Gustatory receptor n=1 Tax=Tetranychus urticae TaxID=32264 RepID=T1KPG2_TETUR
MLFMHWFEYLYCALSKITMRFKRNAMLRPKQIQNVSKLFRLVIVFHSKHDDALAIKDLKRLESICISYNILPNGFSQDQRVTPSKWTTAKSIVYISVMTVHIAHLILLSAFELPDEWHFLLGDFFYGHPNSRFFWIFCLNASIFGEVLRHFWIFLMKNGHLTTLKLQHLAYSKGFKSQVLLMDQYFCQKFSFFATNIAIFWVRILFLASISFAPILIFIFNSVSALPKTGQQFIYTGFWLVISYLGIVFTISNLMLTGCVAAIHLSYFYFKTAHVARTVRDLATKRSYTNNDDYLLNYKATVCEIIQYQKETEQANIHFRNCLIFFYFGNSFAANFGVYIGVFVHIDHGFMDFFIAGVSMIGLIGIGACSYTNGAILTKMSSCCKNLRKVTRYLQLNEEDFIKGTDLEDRLSRTDISFTIGKVLDMTTRIFVIYLIENICLIMMFKVNFQ